MWVVLLLIVVPFRKSKIVCMYIDDVDDLVPVVDNEDEDNDDDDDVFMCIVIIWLVLILLVLLLLLFAGTGDSAGADCFVPPILC